MKRVYKLLATIKDNGLSKTYNNSIDNLEHLKLTLLDGKNEIDDKIIDLVADSKYIEVSQLTSIPNMIQEVISEINNQILTKSVIETEHSLSQSNEVNMSNKDFENISSEKKIEESKFMTSSMSEDSCVSTMRDLCVGAKILHRTLGIGDILEIQKGTNGYCDRIVIKFNSDMESRVFNCMPATLSRHFVIDVDEDTENDNGETVYDYKGFITSIKGLKVGANLYHNLFGIGQILSLEDGVNNTKVLNIQFKNEEKPKKFSCTPEILSKYFGIKDSEKLLDLEKVEKQSKVNIDNTIEDSRNQVSKDKEETGYSIAIAPNLKRLLHKIETVIYRQGAGISRKEYSEYFTYYLKDSRVCTITWGTKYLSIYFNVPLGKLEDKKHLLQENKGHHITGLYKLKITGNIYLEDIEEYIIQAFKYYKQIQN